MQWGKVLGSTGTRSTLVYIHASEKLKAPISVVSVHRRYVEVKVKNRRRLRIPGSNSKERYSAWYASGLRHRATLVRKNGRMKKSIKNTYEAALGGGQ